MNMNLSEFNLLPVPQKAQVVCQRGACLCETMREGRLVVLYQLYNFYVEVYFSCKTSELMQLSGFPHPEFIRRYSAKRYAPSAGIC